jgi:hypothetical protein
MSLAENKSAHTRVGRAHATTPGAIIRLPLAGHFTQTYMFFKAVQHLFPLNSTLKLQVPRHGLLSYKAARLV